MTPRLVAVVFGTTKRLEYLAFLGQENPYARMARVLAYTAAYHCPAWERSITCVQPAALAHHRTASVSHVANTQKMECWYGAIAAAPDGARVLLIDADTAILRPLDDVWTEDFDIAYTTKPSRFPFNSGVVFVQVNERSRAFMQIWRDENLRMLTAETHHQAWRHKYGGINQAALGYALESDLARHVRLRQLPCREWNCEDTSWDTYNPAVTRILHVKSALRSAIFHPQVSVLRKVRRVRRVWLALEQAALGAEAAMA